MDKLMTIAALFASALAYGNNIGNLSTKKSLSLDGARAVINAAVNQARQNKTTGVIAVVDDGGNLMALERIDGTFAAGANISIGKARTAALFQKPTMFFEDIIAQGADRHGRVERLHSAAGRRADLMADGQIVGASGSERRGERGAG